MRRSTLVFAAAATVVLGACRNGEVVVTASLDVPDPEQEGATRSQTLDDIEVEILPFDRDLVFDSLAGVAETPEPEIPPALLEAQDSIAAAQERWQALETRWGTLRDTLQNLNETMNRYSPAEPRYRQLYSLWNDLDAERGRVERQKERAFTRFDSLSKASLEQQDQIRIQRENWANDAFADVDAVFLAKTREAGREVQVDTTGTDEVPGTVTFTGLKKGRWWVTARYELPYTELYWNVPVDVEGGDPVTVELTRANALERPKL